MESWNSVNAYGPQADLDRLKALLIVTGDNGERTIDFTRVLPKPEDPRVDNFRDWEQQQDGMYTFAFDTRWCFPFDVFHRLAALFPTIAFDCDAIHEMDEWCGYGWFNTPEGGEDFDDQYDVPEGYWDHNVKRDPIAELRYLNLVARMKGER
jgi:hypothetical protein